VKPGTTVNLMGVHSSERVPCTDMDCSEDHWERPAGDGTRHLPNVTRTAADGSTSQWFRYHRAGERTGVPAVFVGEEPASKASVTYWDEAGKMSIEEAQVLAVETNTPMRQRTADGVWEKMRVEYFDLPGAKQRVRLVLSDGTQVTAEAEDVEEA
jgi:hypothetical protein